MTSDRQSGLSARTYETSDRGRFLGQAALIAAVFAMGLFAGSRFAPNDDSPVVYEAGRLVASGALENALYDPQARTGEGPRAGTAFSTPQGETCRRFQDGIVRGVACQRGGDWRVVELRQPDPL